MDKVVQQGALGASEAFSAFMNGGIRVAPAPTSPAIYDTLIALQHPIDHKDPIIMDDSKPADFMVRPLRSCYCIFFETMEVIQFY